MRRSLQTLLAASVLILSLAGHTLAGLPEDFQIRARVGVYDLQAGDEEDQPFELGRAAPGTKSVGRAVLLSALLPGLGEIYAGGKRGYLTGAAFAATDVLSMVGYFSNNGKGDDKKDQYQRFAREHYDTDRFDSYVRDTVVVYSGSDAFGFCEEGQTHDEEECQRQIEEVFPLAGEDDDTFYEQIDLNDRYVFGWDDWNPAPDHQLLWVDWNPYGELPDGIPRTTAHRQEYQSMRQDADDFYAKADRYAWIMVIGRVVSMVDAAILVKLRNRDLASMGSNPRLSFRVGMRHGPNLKVTLKMRF